MSMLQNFASGRLTLPGQVFDPELLNAGLNVDARTGLAPIPEEKSPRSVTSSANVSANVTPLLKAVSPSAADPSDLDGFSLDVPAEDEAQPDERGPRLIDSGPVAPQPRSFLELMRGGSGFSAEQREWYACQQALARLPYFPAGRGRSEADERVAVKEREPIHSGKNDCRVREQAKGVVSRIKELPIDGDHYRSCRVSGEVNEELIRLVGQELGSGQSIRLYFDSWAVVLDCLARGDVRRRDQLRTGDLGREDLFLKSDTYR